MNKISFLIFFYFFLLIGCELNKAKNVKARKDSFKINDYEIISLLENPHETIASSITVFFLPKSQDTGSLGINSASVDLLSQKRKIARIIVQNNLKIANHKNLALKAASFLFNPTFQCVKMLTSLQDKMTCEAQLNEKNRNPTNCDEHISNWEALSDYHTYIDNCLEQKKTLEENKSSAETLASEIVMSVGIENWLTLDPVAYAEIDFKENSSSISLSFGHPKAISYSTDEGSIRNLTWDSNIRELHFEIDEKNQDGVSNGDLLTVTLEKSALGQYQTYSGSIKRIHHGMMQAEGKMNLEFKILKP